MAEITDKIRKAYEKHKVGKYLDGHEIDTATRNKVMSAQEKEKPKGEGQK